MGIAYHPFLHGALLAHRDAYDFIELPLDLYSEPARAALLDPADTRLNEIVAAKPCTWRGTALSLGSVESMADPAPDQRIVDRIRALMAKTGAVRYGDVIGFRRLGHHDLGTPQNLPWTDTAARWIAARYAAARDALGRDFSLQLAAASAGASTAMEAAAFLGRIAAYTDVDLVLDVDDLARLAAPGIGADEVLRRLPVEHITSLVTSGEREEDWAVLSRLSGLLAARTVIIRRTRNLFPLDAIEQAARRAGTLLASRHERTPAARAPAETSMPADPDGLADLQTYQVKLIQDCLTPQAEKSALATSVQGWQVWRERLEDTYKAQQISQFLAEEAGSYGRQGG